LKSARTPLKNEEDGLRIVHSAELSDMTPSPPVAATRRKSFSMALEKSGSIGIANAVF
jgi:hypothetical protein